MIDQIHWLGHGSFRIEGPPIIYINPWRVQRKVFHADIILIGHDHYEHFSPADVEKLRGEYTHVIANESIAEELNDVTVLRPWQTIQIDNIAIKAVPAYSILSSLHPKSDGGLGFIISMNYYDIYYAGDTEQIPEMDRIRPDIAILPIDGNGTMNAQMTTAAALAMQPKWVIPSNWDGVDMGGIELISEQLKEGPELIRLPLQKD